MRVLILNYEFPPLGGGGGNGSYNLAKELTQAGNSVDVLTSRAAGQLRQEVLHGINVYRVTSWRKGIHDSGLRGAFTYLCFACPQFFALTSANNYDVIHYFFSLPTGFLSVLPGRHRKVPYLVSLRGSDVPGYDPYNRSLQWFHRLLLPLTRKIWRDADRVVALSNNLKKMAMETDASVNFSVIPNGVDAKLFARLPGSAGDQFRMLTVSRLIERKGIQHALIAMSELEQKDIHLTIVGEGNYSQALIDLCKKLGLDDRVNFYGYCAREKLPELFVDCDLFVLPSMAEAFGQVYVEAMSCGVAVVGGRTGGVSDIIGPDNGILVEPGSVDEIKQAILTLYHDRDRCLQMGENNRKRVLENYSWATVAEQYSDYYKKSHPSVGLLGPGTC